MRISIAFDLWSDQTFVWEISKYRWKIRQARKWISRTKSKPNKKNRVSI